MRIKSKEKFLEALIEEGKNGHPMGALKYGYEWLYEKRYAKYFTEDVIREYRDYINWDYLCKYTKLSINMLHELEEEYIDIVEYVMYEYEIYHDEWANRNEEEPDDFDYELIKEYKDIFIKYIEENYNKKYQWRKELAYRRYDCKKCKFID